MKQSDLGKSLDHNPQHWLYGMTWYDFHRYAYPQDEDYEWVVQLDGAGEEGQHHHQPIEIKAEDVKQAHHRWPIR